MTKIEFETGACLFNHLHHPNVWRLGLLQGSISSQF